MRRVESCYEFSYDSGRPSLYKGISLDPITLILPKQQQSHQLYIGDYFDAKNIKLLKQKNIMSVLTLAKGLGIYYKKGQIQNHKIIAIQDQENQALAPFFQQIYNYIQKQRVIGPVLVHCQAGVSRSPSAVISYIMIKNLWSFKKAFQFVKSKRKNTHPNYGFINQLFKLQKQKYNLNRKSSKIFIARQYNYRRKYNLNNKYTEKPKYSYCLRQFR